MSKSSKRAGIMIGLARALVTLTFLFAGGYKLAAPASALAGPIPLPVGFLRFIGGAEVMGALGLVLPGLLGLHRWLEPLAALGLVVIMIGATVVSAIALGPGAAILPFVVGLVCASIVKGSRSRVELPAAAGRQLPNSGEVRAGKGQGVSAAGDVAGVVDPVVA